MRHPDHLGDWVHGAEGVRHVHDRDDFRAVRQQRFVLVEPQLAGVGHRHHPQPRILLLAQQLPGHDVRVVFHRRDEHLVSGANVRASVAVRDEVDRLGRAADEDDLLDVARVEKPADRLS